MPEHDADLALMRDAARKAGEIALDFAANGAAAWEKSPGHPVTEADLAVNAYLEARLRDERGDYGWLSEETADDAERLRRRRVWVVDPIDGTRAYMRGGADWCVGLALVEDGAAVAGVVYAPVQDELYDAAAGAGARLNGAPIGVSERASETGARLIVAKELPAHPSWPEPWPEMIVCDPKPNATLYRMALVAAGRWDGAMALWRKSDWDVAAGAVLINEAGGAATTHLGEDLVFNRPAPAQRSLVAAGKGLHPLLIGRTRVVRLPDPNATSRKDAPKPMSDAPQAQKQLLHLVIGGELKDVSDIEFEDLSKVDFVGAYPNYKAAYDAWKSAAQRTVDNAEMRYFIIHAHRLLDPETGSQHPA